MVGFPFPSPDLLADPIAGPGRGGRQPRSRFLDGRAP